MMSRQCAGVTVVAVGLFSAVPALGQGLPDFSNIPELKLCIVAVQEQSEDAFASLERTNPENATVTDVLARDDGAGAHASTFYTLDDGQLTFSVDRVSEKRFTYSCEIHKHRSNVEAATATMRAFGQWTEAVAAESDMFMAETVEHGAILSGCQDAGALYVAATDHSEADEGSVDYLLTVIVSDTLLGRACS